MARDCPCGACYISLPYIVVQLSRQKSKLFTLKVLAFYCGIAKLKRGKGGAESLRGGSSCGDLYTESVIQC